MKVVWILKIMVAFKYNSSVSKGSFYYPNAHYPNFYYPNAHRKVVLYLYDISKCTIKRLKKEIDDVIVCFSFLVMR